MPTGTRRNLFPESGSQCETLSRDHQGRGHGPRKHNKNMIRKSKVKTGFCRRSFITVQFAILDQSTRYWALLAAKLKGVPKNPRNMTLD